jgi:glycerol-3-phosphate dehydrogenase (NAD(P)+)
VLGAGSWGTALAILLAKNGHKVGLWDRNREHAAALAGHRENRRHLPGITLPDAVHPTADLSAVLATADFVLIVVPSAGFRAVLRNARVHFGAPPKLIWASKGLEPDTSRFIHQIVDEELPGHTTAAAISGPSFATEVARGLPTAVTVASKNADYATTVAELFHGQRFRANTSDDIVGVERGGAVKNVLAIAAGISDGLGYGANARAALITRGLAEIMRLGAVLGCQRETLMGLSGVGDLVLTCTDDQSRNRRLGLALGRGTPLDQAVADIGQAIEGLQTAKALQALATAYAVDMPITAEVRQVLCSGQPAATAVENLLSREAKPEAD